MPRIFFFYKTITAACIIFYLKASQYKSPEEHTIEHTVLLPRYASRRSSMYSGEGRRGEGMIEVQQRKSGRDEGNYPYLHQNIGRPLL